MFLCYYVQEGDGMTKIFFLSFATIGLAVVFCAFVSLFYPPAQFWMSRDAILFCFVGVFVLGLIDKWVDNE